MSEAITITDWHGCYEGGWQDAIVPEAFAHPAKFSRSLIVRIIRYGLDQGYWKAGDTIGDCFGGVALGGIIAGYHGLNWIGVELEPRFVELGNKNLAMHGPRWMALEQATSVRLVQGDSRRFAEIVGEVCGVVSSPPYAESLHLNESQEVQVARLAAKGNHAAIAKMSGNSASGNQGYGATSGNIGNLPAGQLDAVVSSPPYAESIKGDHGERETAAESTAKRQTPGGSLGQSQRHGGYGATVGNIGNLKDGAVDAVVTSPPFTQGYQSGGGINKNGYGPGGADKVGERTYQALGGERSPDNIERTEGETYWQAMRQVYSQMRLALKPGGVAAIVCKDYVKDKARVPLCDQTCTLLESLGFDVFERCRCWLVKEDRHPGLFDGEDVVKTTERKSFFRRLAEKKGSPRIDWEEVIWCRRPI